MQCVEWTIIHDTSKIKNMASLSIEGIRNDISNNPTGANATTAYVPEIVKNWDLGKDEILWNAPAVIIASTPSWVESGKEDLILALSYLDIAAPSMGLGTCWTGSFAGSIALSPTLKKELCLTGSNTHYYSMVLGYPKFKHFRMVQRKEPKIRWI